ncbi:M43 family zinc metalloprotease [Parasediminibacterium paludis]|uniref:M43 family zinc metalloprotease n=1 Tax=Parasediminibacterium paludis TaxID=908966 RepID=A0ABV8PVD4_9BACT
MQTAIKFLLGLLIFTSTLQAQEQCGSVFNPQTVQSNDPNRYNRYQQLEQHIASYISSINNTNPNERLINPNSTIIIPVVVHVLHNGEAIGVGRNISDAQVQSQIDVLNEDFRRLNANRINTPNAFIGVAADPNIEFRLTCTDPNGNATNGIHRVQTNVAQFDYVTNSDGTPNETATGIKYTVTGGTDAWPTDRYLNMWVCSIAPTPSGQLLGYAQFPFDYATKPNTDGVVALNTAFGRVGNLRFQYDQGRTITHEVGHWLDLFHIWGDAACGNDQCNDTPQQLTANQSNCPGFPHFSNCANNGANGDMFMNYMDYTVDNCKNIYTQDQTNRMRAIFATGGPRASFIENYFHINTPNIGNGFCIGTQINVTATNLACLPITWSVSGPVSITGGQNTNQLTIQATGNANATIVATAGGYTSSINITVGIPNANISVLPFTTGQQYCTNSFGNTLIISPANAAESYQWGYSSSQNSIQPTIINQNGSSEQNFNFYLGGNYQIFANPQNACGIGPIATLDIFVNDNCGGGGFGFFAVSPNPTTGDVQVETTGTDKTTTIKEIQVTDKLGNVKKKIKLGADTKKHKISIADLPADVYIIRIYDGKTWTSKKVIKN